MWLLMLLLSLIFPPHPLSSVSPFSQMTLIIFINAHRRQRPMLLRLHGHCNVVIVELLTVISHSNATPLALAALHDCLACCFDLVLFVRRGRATAVCKQQQTHSVAADGFAVQQTGRRRGCFATCAKARGGLLGLLDLHLFLKIPPILRWASLILSSSGVIISQQSDGDGCR